MQYIDPYTLFEFNPDSPEELDRSQIKRARQKILAEFELSEDIVIDFKGHSVDKSTALRLLEELEDHGKKWQHWYLHKNPFLQQFLSLQQVRFLRNIAPAEELGDEAFREFLSAQLVPIFDKLLTENFKNGRKPEVSLLIERLDLIHSKDHDTALKGTLRHLNLNIQSLKDAVRGEGTTLAFFDGQELYNSTLIELLNRLPSLYQHVRNRYADALQDLAIALENEWSFTNKAFAVICAAAELETDLSTREHINHLKVVLWKRQRARREDEASAPKQQAYDYDTEDQNQESTQPFEFQWENSEQTGPKENFFNRKTPKNSATAAWVIIGLLILLVSFFVRGNWKAPKSYKSPSYSYKVPNLPKVPEWVNLDAVSESSEIGQTKFEVFSALAYQEPSQKVASSQDFKTGDQPYSLIFSDISPVDPSLDQITVENNSDFDLVVFIEDFLRHSIDHHFFVKAGEDYELTDLDPGNKYLTIYSGKDWKSNAFTYLDGAIGGFTKNSKAPPTTSRNDLPNAILLMLSYNSGIVGGKNHVAKFDGEEVSIER